MVFVKEYASALFELALENKRVDEIYQTFNTVLDELNEYPEFLKLMGHPQISREEKHAIIDQVFVDSDRTFRHFLYVLVDRDRFTYIHPIFDAFEKMYHQYKEKLKVIAITAEPLTENLKSRIIESLSQKYGKAIVLETQVDPSVMGGIRLVVDDEVIDFSVTTLLSSLKQSILDSLNSI